MIVGASPELSRKASSIHPPGGTPGTRTAHYYFFYFFAIVIIDPSIKFSLPTALCCNNSWVVAHSDRMNAGLYESPSLASGSPSNAKHTTYHL